MLSWECLIEGYKISGSFDPQFSSEIPEKPSHSFFLAEAHSEKIEQMHMLLVPSGPGKARWPGTRGGRAKCHLVSDTFQSRLILLVADLAAMSINTPSCSIVLPNTPLADTVVSSTEGLRSGCFWLFSSFPWVLLSQFKIRPKVEHKQPGKGWTEKWLTAFANVRGKPGQLRSRNHL